MRFGRRVKHRLQESATPGDSGSSALGIVAGAERDAILDFNRSAPDTGQNSPYDADPTQELLTALGHFQQNLSDAQAGAAQEDWSDEAMNQLISGVEVALGQNWREVVEALTDTGRVLHTFEGVGRANECVPFLCDAYEILCLMAGDLIVDSIRQSVKDKWHNRFIVAIAEMEAAGLTLIEDDAPASPPGASGFQASATPFELPDDADESWEAASAIEAPELPTFDELPPLDVLREPRLDDTAAAAPPNTQPPGVPVLSPAAPSGIFGAFGAVSYVDQPEAPYTTAELPPLEAAPDTGSEISSGPSKFVVDVLDRTCDQLSVINRASTKERALLIERMIGGVAALRREAGLMGSPVAMDLCDSMEAVFKAAMPREGELGERFIDLGYAFSGVYMEAVQDGHTVSAEEWRTESSALIASWDSPLSTEPGIGSSRNDGAYNGEIADGEANDRDSLAGPFAEPFDAEASLPETRDPAVEAPALDEFAAPLAPGDDGSASSGIQISDGRAPSRHYLDAAQQAALDGDAARAKHFALLAAASIAREEAIRAEHRLHETEIRLKQGLQAAEGAREDVRRSEQAVSHVAAEVAAGMQALEAVRESANSISRDADAAQSRVGELDEQIRLLQARREEALAEVGEARARRDTARAGEAAAEQAIADLRAVEQDARLRLERSRQGVKEHQRSIAEIETEMESTRESMARQKRSVADIEQTIHHVSDGDLEADADPQLF